MKMKMLMLVVLSAVATFTPYDSLAVPAGPCTRYGCDWIEYMANMRYVNGAWQAGCLKFEGHGMFGDTRHGRKVRSQTLQGRNPIRLPGRQRTEFGPQECAACDPPIPMSQNSIAIQGFDPGGALPFTGSFGRYTCPPVNNNGGGAVGGPN